MAEAAPSTAEGSAEETAPKVTISAQFTKFCNFGNHGKPAKKMLTDKNLTKMFKDCKLYGKSLTSTDTDIAFSKVKDKGKKEITLAQFKELLKTVAPKYQKEKKLETPDEAYNAMVDVICQTDPSVHGTTSTVKAEVVNRMTDHKQYTGTHKERFDDSGKGKGIAGRQEVNANEGYVQGYKDRGTYEQKTKDK